MCSWLHVHAVCVCTAVGPVFAVGSKVPACSLHLSPPNSISTRLTQPCWHRYHPRADLVLTLSCAYHVPAAPIAFRGSWAPQAKNNAGKIDCFLLARKAEPCPASGLALCHGHPQALRVWGHGVRWHHTGWDAWLSAGSTPSARSPDSVFPRGHHEWMRDVATSAPHREVSQGTDTQHGAEGTRCAHPVLSKGLWWLLVGGYGDTEQCDGGTWALCGWEGWRPPWKCTTPSLWLLGCLEPWKAVPISMCVPIHVPVAISDPIHVLIPAAVCSSLGPAQLLCLHLPPPCPTWHREVAVS